MNKVAQIPLLVIVTILGTLNPKSYSATLGTDNGGNYSGAWTTGTSFGTGFGNWDLWTLGTNTNNFAGHFIDAGRFGMYANSSLSTGRTAEAYAQRLFNGGNLTAGQSFWIDLGVSFRNGFKGIDLFSGSFTTVWNFNIGGDAYSPGGVALSDAVAPYLGDSVFNVRASQLTVNTFKVEVFRGGANLYTSAPLSGAINGFKLYIGQTDPGGENNLFANNLQVIPEPSTPLLMGLGLAGLFALRKTRKA